MRLLELDPRWCASMSAERHGMGISFLCPCCFKKGFRDRWVVYFANPLDGGECMPNESGHSAYRWARIGGTFDTLTLAPSINLTTDGNKELGIPAEQHWHGFICNGEVTTV
jgi:hypothetical protein